MATIYIRLDAAIFGFAAGTTVQADDTDPAVVNLLNANLAASVANPGGTPPVLDPSDPQDPALALGAQAASVTAVGDLDDTVGSVTATALAVGMAAGAIATVTFTAARDAAPRAVLISDRSAADRGLFVSAKSATDFTVSSRVAAAASEALAFDYAVID